MYQIYGFDWCKPNHLNLQFKMRKTSPLVANGYPLSGENPILKSGKIIPLFLQDKSGLRGSASQLIFIFKYRYCIARFRCEKPSTRYFMGRAKEKECELYKLTITLIK